MSVWACYLSWYVYQIRFRNYDSNYSFSVFKSWSILSKYLWKAIFESQQQVYMLCKVWPGLWVGPSLTIRLFLKPNLVFVCPEGRIYGVLLKCLSSWEDFWSSVRAIIQGKFGYTVWSDIQEVWCLQMSLTVIGVTVLLGTLLYTSLVPICPSSFADFYSKFCGLH